MTAEMCKGLLGVHEVALAGAMEASEEGNEPLEEAYLEVSGDAKQEARQLGCKWSRR